MKAVKKFTPRVLTSKPTGGYTQVRPDNTTNTYPGVKVEFTPKWHIKFWKVNINHRMMRLFYACYTQAVKALQKRAALMGILGNVVNVQLKQDNVGCESQLFMHFCFHQYSSSTSLSFLPSFPNSFSLSPASSRREALPLYLGGLYLALCPLRRADPTLPQAHGDQTLPLHRVWPLLLTVRPPLPAPPSPRHDVNSDFPPERPIKPPLEPLPPLPSQHILYQCSYTVIPSTSHIRILSPIGK